MLLALLFCYSSLARSATKLCSTQEDTGICNTVSSFESGHSLLQTTVFRQKTSQNQNETQFASEIAIRRGEHPTKFATSPYAGVLLQKALDGTVQKKGAPPPPPPPPPLPTHPDPAPSHVPEKCVTRKSTFSNYFSMGDCCAATTQAAACLDGYLLRWSEKKCALGHDGTSASGANAESSSSLFSATAGAAAGSITSSGARTFECHPPPVDDSGPREKGMPGTQHRRRWAYDKAGAEGKTGSCCGHFSCKSCEESYAIQNGNIQCGLGESWLCASQHR